jgi:hypothetical protein
MHLVAAARGAMNGFMAEIVEDHIRFHVSDPANDPDRDRAPSSAHAFSVRNWSGVTIVTSPRSGRHEQLIQPRPKMGYRLGVPPGRHDQQCADVRLNEPR